ncbi:DMT family transporter [Pyrococcus abyssi]|uniref:Predicted permease n=1 Tax=Pyrococcus abyssi (strain GE5 / Orsay) TaxID=272844 RepID=Q9V1J3_PYRAB|nr:DMT family transporter [Pyrococcus abyssi]CAB49356.1 Predicted permease [Pyrococcus abyssi GE5]CCE69815.1 TPA: hypothetical protein PAB0285 [Pyrococcus abyssi GE5]
MSFALGVILALAAAFTWALSSVLSKVSMRRVSPFTLNSLRLFIASAFYIPLIIYLDLFPDKGLFWWIIVILSGIIGFLVADWLFLEGINIIGVSRANLLVTPHPILTMVLAHYFLDRPLNASIAFGAILIVLAVIILLSEGKDSSDISLRGVGLVIVAELMWTLAVLITDWLVSDESAVLITGLRIASGALGTTFLLPRISQEVKKLKMRDLGLIFVITLLGTILGQYFFVKSISIVSSSVATPVTESTPIMAALMAIIFLKERFTKKLGISLVLATLGILLIGLGC